MTVAQKRVLIVEDEVIIALDFSDSVAELGYEIVGPALSLAQGMELARTQDVDCALLDVNLGGGLTSQPIAETLRDKQVRVAFVTAYDRGSVSFALEDEAIVPKPPSQLVLTQLLGALCG